jgi:predicted nucleic acid-binding protein
MILIDTDIVIDVLRAFPPALTWLDSLSDSPVTVVGFTILEILQGCWNPTSLRQTQRALAPYQIVWPDDMALERTLQRFGTRRLSHGLGIIDALIAETAIGLNLPLHTFNVRHFAAYPELKTVQPYQKT